METSFELFLRDRKKIVIDVDKLYKNNHYAHIVKQLYKDDILVSVGYWMERKYKKIPNNPNLNRFADRFIFKEPIENRYYSIYDNITTDELNYMCKIRPQNEVFELVFKSFNKSDMDRSCFYCKTNFYYDPKNEYYLCCSFCREYYCPHCVIEIRDMYFVGCGIFKCRKCKWVIDMFI